MSEATKATKYIINGKEETENKKLWQNTFRNLLSLRRNDWALSGFFWEENVRSLDQFGQICLVESIDKLIDSLTEILIFADIFILTQSDTNEQHCLPQISDILCRFRGTFIEVNRSFEMGN